METIRFIRNAHVVFEREGGGTLDDRHFKRGVTWETTREIGTQLIREGAAVPDILQYGSPQRIGT